MNPIFWFPIGGVLIGLLAGAYWGARSASSSAKSGMLIGAYLAFMTSFPLLAIGLANA